MTQQLAIQIGVGVAMMGLTMFMHAVGLGGLMVFMHANLDRLRWGRSWYVKGATMVATLLGLVALHLLEILAYALLYLGVDAVDGFDSAFYFSTASYSTAGIGELVVDDDWRVLGAMEALNGFLLIGWSTALFVSVVLRVWADEKDWLRPGA